MRPLTFTLQWLRLAVLTFVFCSSWEQIHVQMFANFAWGQFEKKNKNKGWSSGYLCYCSTELTSCWLPKNKEKKNSRQLPQHYQLRVFPLFTLMDDRMTGHRTYSLLHTTVTVITADAWAKQSDTFQMSLFKTSRTSHQRERERQTLDTSQQRWELIRIYRFWFHY